MAKDRRIEHSYSEKEEGKTAKNYLLVIGINEYEHFSSLNNAVRDAETIRDILLERYQFEKENTTNLFDKDATKEKILEAFYSFEKDLTSEDNLVVYFAGHGTMNSSRKQGYWIPVDAHREKRSQYISTKIIKEILEDIAAHHIYFIIDSCFSVSIIRNAEKQKNYVESRRSRRALTSGREQVVEDGPMGGHSPFASCIIEYLSKNHANYFSAKELEAYVEKYTSEESDQSPIGARIIGVGDREGQFFFYPSKIPPKVLLSEPKTIPSSGNTRNPISSMEMIFVKGGSFMMGGEENDNEKPIHNVTLDSFEMGKYLMTQKHWKVVMGNNPSYFKKCPDCPVEMVSWDDIQSFLEKINALYPEMNYRLPTEAEWEYAARGGNQSQGYIYAGSNILETVGWYHGNSDRTSHPVGQKIANELGLFDMSGNTWEWCSDWYKSDYFKTSPKINPHGPIIGNHRVLRGGSWNVRASRQRVSNRGNVSPDYKSRFIGFRLARTP